MGVWELLLVGVVVLLGLCGVLVPGVPGSLLLWAGVMWWALEEPRPVAWWVLVGSTTVLLLSRAVRWMLPPRRLELSGASPRMAVYAGVGALLGFVLVPVVGAIPEGLPVPGLPEVGWADVVDLLPVAAGILLVGFTDNVLTARSIADRHGYRIDPNQELLALGLTNLTSGMSQGFPVSSSASRTAVPASLGSRTQVVSLVAAGLVVATLVLLSPVLGEIPRAALAAVIVAAAISIIFM